MITRGKDVMRRARVKAELLDFNHHADGPWEPAIFDRGWGVAAPGMRSSRYYVGHDDSATHDISLPGDGQPFDVDAVVAKLLIAPVVKVT